MKNYEALMEIFSEYYNHNLDEEKMKCIAEDYDNHLSVMYDMEMNSHIDYNKECSACSVLQEQIKELENQNNIYNNFISNNKKCGVGVYNGKLELFEK